MEDSNLKLDFARADDVRKINDLLRDAWLATYPNEELGITEDDILPAFDMSKIDEQKRKEFFQKNPPGPGYWVVRNGDEVCGYMKVRIQPDGRGRIQGLYSHPKYFGKGVGAILMKAALEYMKDCKEVYVECTAYNERAKKFYMKYGFKLDESIKTPGFVLVTGKVLPEQTLIKKKL